ncbi:hypothetical protein GCM10028815_04500 [Mariniluteicoccus flavus]
MTSDFVSLGMDTSSETYGTVTYGPVMAARMNSGWPSGVPDYRSRHEKPPTDAVHDTRGGTRGKVLVSTESDPTEGEARP